MLIKSISGIRGTLGGKCGENFTPVDIVKFASAYGMWLLNQKSKVNPPERPKSFGRAGSQKSKVVIGRDARLSGEMVSAMVSSSLLAMGIDVIDIGLSTTPTVEIAVAEERADGGIVITASHNPKNWNALKLLNSDGEFISEKEGQQILAIARAEEFVFQPVQHLGKRKEVADYFKKHIEKILALDLVDKKAIKEKKFRIAVDAVNSTGGIAVPMLLDALGVEKIFQINCEPTGDFAHNPEPLAEHLRDLSKAVLKNKAHLGIAVDPDVDRLAVVSEDGEMFGEEYTLVAVADYVLRNPSPALPPSVPERQPDKVILAGAGKGKGERITVSNLSSTRALKDVTEKYGGKYFASAVGEVNVVEMMKKTKALIGGEGNGGVIYPALHYGRDALAGIALFLSHLARFGKSCSMLRATYPDYYISKNKIELMNGIDVDKLLNEIKNKYKDFEINIADGVRIDFSDSKLKTQNSKPAKEWVHLRKSNTEPIVRIYAESESQVTADNLAKKIITDIKELIRQHGNI